MRKDNPPVFRPLSAVLWLLLAGCSIPIPQAEKDPTKYYVLSVVSAPAAPRADAPALQLRPVEVANYLSGRPMVIRRGTNEVDFREFARWGESLDLGIARVLREELVAQGAARSVSTSSLRRDAGSERILTVRVLACEGESDGDVVFRAVWELSGPDKDAPARHGDFRPAGLRWDGKHEGSLAAELSRAVSMLAGEIAAALKP